MEFISQFLPQLLGTIIGGASVYAGIRAEIARLEERSKANRDIADRALLRADKAHERIDAL